MRLLVAAGAAVAVLLSLGACADDEPGPDGPTPTWTPSGTLEVPSPTAEPEPDEPALPDAARKATEDGARAFIAYYWELINYAQVTGDVKALRQVSGETCAGCSRVIGAIRDLYRGGGHATGGDYSLTIRRIKDVSPEDKSAYGIEAAIKVRNAVQTIVRGGGSVEQVPPKDSAFLTYTIWVNDHWRTDILEPR